MTEWATRTLGDLCLAINDGDWIETKDQGGSDYRLLQVSNIGLGTFRETGKYRYVTRETFERLRCREILPGMVLVARMPDPVGRAWLVADLAEPAITSVDVAILEPNPATLSARYCMYLLNSPEQLAQRAAEASGTTRLRVTRRQLADTTVRIPDIETQHGVASVLGVIDALIENNRRRVAVLEEMARAIYREWFVHFRFPGHEGATFVDTDLGPIPAGWHASSLGEHSSVITRGIAPKYTDDGQWLVVNQRCIRGGRVSLTNARRHGRAVPGNKRLKHGDVLINSTGVGTLGRVAQWRADINATTDSHVTMVRSERPDDHRWLAHWAACNQESFEALGTGSTGQTELRRSDVEAMRMVVPPVALRSNFDASVGSATELADSLMARVRVLTDVRDALLPKLVTGQIDVSDLDLDAVMEQAAV